MPKKATYFNPDKFVDDVLAAMRLGPVGAPVLMSLREEIEVLLNERIISTVVGGFGARELSLFERILEDHPELDEIDALMVIAPEIPGIKDTLERSINSLFFELAHQARQVEKGMKALTA